MSSRFENVWAYTGMPALLLSPLGALYAIGWWAYEGIYRTGLKKAFEPHAPVVTVGNLMAGGTGKSPMTLFVSGIIQNLGRDVVVSVSGYGSPSSQGAQMAPDGPLRASQWGDEASMFRWLEPSLKLVVGRDRVEAARLVHSSFPGAVMLMDDGFQHLRLRQHTTIVLDPLTYNRFCLPAGPYREPRSTGTRRADLVLPDHRFHQARSDTIVKQVSGLEADPKTSALHLVCAIARPFRLTKSLEAEGYRVAGARLLPDHDPLTAGTLLKGLDSSAALIVTAKDWVKLCDRPDFAGRTVFVAHYEARIEPEQDFAEWLGRQLDEEAGQTTA